MGDMKSKDLLVQDWNIMTLHSTVNHRHQDCGARLNSARSVGPTHQRPAPFNQSARGGLLVSSWSYNPFHSFHSGSSAVSTSPLHLAHSPVQISLYSLVRGSEELRRAMAELPLAAGLLGMRHCKLSPKPPPPPPLPLPARRCTHTTSAAAAAPSPRRAVPELHSTTGKC
jgi:hypothetical protein